jgi:hypothetical protein
LRAKTYAGTQFVHSICHDNPTFWQSMLSAGKYFHSAGRSKNPNARSMAQFSKINHTQVKSHRDRPIGNNA